MRRKPKEVGEPTLYEAGGAGRGAGGDPTAPGPGPAGAGSSSSGSSSRGSSSGGSSSAQGKEGGGAAPGVTDDVATLLAAAPDEVVADPETVRRARQIAARLAVPRARRDSTARRGAGELASVRYRGGSDDIDLDRTLDQLVEHPVPDDDDIIVRERIRTRRSVVLLVDVSGSMRGERVRTAAATVGALAGELERDALAVVAFWSDAAVLVHLGHRISSRRLLDTLLRIPARGLTNVAFPLQVAARELARVPARDARVLLLSDCVHNAGPDPRDVAGRLPRLDVLLDISGEHDLDLGRELAALGRGRLRLIETYRDVAPGLAAIFGESS